MSNDPVLVMDCESAGLYGDTFAVGCVLLVPPGEGPPWSGGHMVYEAHSGLSRARGTEGDLRWVRERVPARLLEGPDVDLGLWFRNLWFDIAFRYPGALMAADCMWPVEAGFLLRAFRDRSGGPYPLIDVASVLYAAGMDPLGVYPRSKVELPEHDPLRDAAQSARLLSEAMCALGRWSHSWSIEWGWQRAGSADKA